MVDGWIILDKPVGLGSTQAVGGEAVIVGAGGVQPSVVRTWARRGKTPVIRCWQRRDRLLVIRADLKTEPAEKQ